MFIAHGVRAQVEVAAGEFPAHSMLGEPKAALLRLSAALVLLMVVASFLISVRVWESSINDFSQVMGQGSRLLCCYGQNATLNCQTWVASTKVFQEKEEEEKREEKQEGQEKE